MDKYHIDVRDVESFEDCQPLQLGITVEADDSNFKLLIRALRKRYALPQYQIVVTMEIAERYPVDISAL